LGVLPSVYDPNVRYYVGDVFINPEDKTDWQQVLNDDVTALLYSLPNQGLKTASAAGLFEEPIYETLEDLVYFASYA
jgi:hypothetical protein